MAKEILLTPENLESEASKLLGNKSSLDGVFANIASLISGLLEHWRGEAQNAFSNSFTQKRKDFDKFSQNMQEFADFMKKYANEMRELENRHKALAGKLG